MSNINITFLGTASAQPSRTRNHSALSLRLNGDVHGDHIFGLVPLLASRLNGAGGMVDQTLDPRASGVIDTEPLEIYGPSGTRAYVRTGLLFTHTLLSGSYVVHELKFPNDPPDPLASLPRHAAELPGRDIRQVDSIWPEIYRDASFSVSAGKIDPKQYIPHLKRTGTPMSVMRQLQQGETIVLPDETILHGPSKRAGRKIAVLGDTYDPSPIAELAMHADVLIHEATNAHLPGIDPETKPSDTFSIVEERSKLRGHSTPQMAGLFAARVNARKLVLNHFSSRYAGDYDPTTQHGDPRPVAKETMEAIRTLAQSHFDGPVVCARDFMAFDVQHNHDVQ